MRNAIIAILAVALTAPVALGQGYAAPSYRPTTGHTTRNTTSWHNYTPPAHTHFNTQRTNRYQRPIPSVRDYTINKYFVGNPNLSPYLHLTRPQAATGLDNYHRFVVPEVVKRPTLPNYNHYLAPWNR